MARLTRIEALEIVLQYARKAYPSEDYIASLDSERDASELDSIADLHDALAILEPETDELEPGDRPASEIILGRK